MSKPYTNDCNHGQLISLPVALRHPGGDVLDIQVAGYRLAEVASRHRAGALSELVVGPHDELAPRLDRQMALAVGSAQGASVTLLLIGGFMLVLGLMNRRESHLAHFGALSIGLALFDSRRWLRDLPFSHGTTELALLVFLALITWAAVQYMLRTQGARHKLADLGLPAQLVLMLLSLWLAGPQHLRAVALAWQLIFGAEIAAVAVLHLRQRTRKGPWWPTSVLLGFAALAVLAHLLSAQPGSFSWPSALAEALLPLVVVVIGLRLVHRHGRARDEAERSRIQLEQTKQQLEQRVREVTAEVERNLRQLSDLKIEQVTERERKRIAADLHDDLGAKLLTIVHTSESERISTLAREALEEMRLSVRGLIGRPVRLADALGDWRAETVLRLGQAGIEGNWHGADDLPQTLSSRAYVQTTRILREATSNIIKHSGASHCSVRCSIADGDFQLIIQDNGEGISSKEVDARLDRGHGLASMKNRAKQLQGQCLVESGPGYGTVIRLTLPLEQATGTS